MLAYGVDDHIQMSRLKTFRGEMMIGRRQMSSERVDNCAIKVYRRGAILLHV